MASSISGFTNNTNRVFGLSGSGIDVDSMVQKIMSAKRAPYDKLIQRQTVVGWKKEAYNSFYNSISEFRNTKLYNFQMKNTLAAKTVTSSSSSTVTATANGDAAPINHSISVLQLASGVTQMSSGKITTGTDKSTLAKQFNFAQGTFDITINGKKITVDTNKSINDMVSSINKADAGVTASYDATQDRLVMYTNSIGSSAKIDYSGTSTVGLDFLTNGLKLSALTGVNSNGITSGSNIGFSDQANLASQFSGLAGSFSLKVSTAQGSVANILVDTSKNSLSDIMNQINSLKDSSGHQAAYASMDSSGNFVLKAANDANPISLAGSDAAAISFLNNQLKLSSNVDGTTALGSVGASSRLDVGDGTETVSSLGISSSFNLNITSNGTTYSVAVDPSDKINDVLLKISTVGGGTVAMANLGSGRIFLHACDPANPITIDGDSSTPQAAVFLQKLNLHSGTMSTSSSIDASGVSSSAQVGTDLTSPLFPGNSTSFDVKISDGTTTKTVTLHYNDSLQTMMNTINGTGIATATFDHGKFTLKATNSGATLDLSGSDATAQDFLTNGLKLISQTGTDAQVKLDGVTMTQSKNTFTMSGVTYNLQSTGSSTVMVQNDIDGIIKSVKTFISDYNTLLDSINDKVDEKYDSNYLPLTDEQKQAMQDTDVSLWTAKAKTGLLHNDSTLKTLANSMRDAFVSPVSGVSGNYKTAVSLGITTSTDYTEEGKLYLDEDTLRTALENDPQCVYKIFGTTDDSQSTTFDASKNGIATRLYKYTQTAIDSITSEAGTKASTTDTTSTLGKEYKDYTTKITDMYTKLQKMENSYYSQYSKMEEALAKLNQQSTQLSSMLGTN